MLGMILAFYLIWT